MFRAPNVSSTHGFGSAMRKIRVALTGAATIVSTTFSLLRLYASGSQERGSTATRRDRTIFRFGWNWTTVDFW